MREDQVLVDPGSGLRSQAVGCHLARGKHDLSLCAADRVAVYVHVGEGVVLPQRLQLPVGSQQRPVVPQAHVLHGGAVAGHRRGVERRGAELALPHPVKTETSQRARNGVPDERRLGGQLAGTHAQRLHQARVHPQTPGPGHDDQRNRPDRQAHRAQPGVGDQQQPARREEHGQHAQRRQYRVDVGKRGAEDRPTRRVEEIEGIQPEPEPARQHCRSQQRREVRAHT